MKAKVFGRHDEATLRQIENCIDAGGERGVLCADGHKGYAQPIGGVVAYKDGISLSGVGFDIACGNLAVLTDAKGSEVAQIGEHTSELQSPVHLVCRLLLEKKNTKIKYHS